MSGLVDRNHPELDLALLLQVLDLEGQRFGSRRGVKPAAVVPLGPALQLLLDDVVSDLAAAVAGRRGPNEVHGGVVVVRDLWGSRLARLVWREGRGWEEGRGGEKQKHKIRRIVKCLVMRQMVENTIDRMLRDKEVKGLMKMSKISRQLNALLELYNYNVTNKCG